MRENATHEYLLKHLYKETGVTENQAINDALDVNYKLREELESFEDVKEMLDTVSYTPHRSVVRSILKYSRKMNALEPTC